MKILLIHPQKEVLDMLVFPLESNLGATTVGVSSETESKTQVLEKNFNPEVVIAHNSKEILNFLPQLLADAKLNPRLALCDGVPATQDPKIPGTTYIGYAGAEDLLGSLTQLIKGKIKSEAVELAGDDSKYCRINTGLLLKVNPLAAAIYIRLTASHYVKLFNKNDVFDEQDLEKYRNKKNVEYLYLPKEECNVFVDKMVAELERMLHATPSPGPVTVADTVQNTVETVHELIAKFGVTESVQKAVKGSVDVAMKSMGEFPQLADILKNIKDHQGKYIGHHSMLLSQIACSIAVAMDWYSESTFEKLTMAAFLHDASLQSHDLCAVKELSEFEKKYKGKFTAVDIQNYKGHPQSATLMLGHFKDAPAEVDKIILMHHEHPMGTGFPAQLTSNYISPLATLFIVAHDLTDYLIEKNGAINMEDFLIDNEKKYSSGNFKKIARSIASLTL